jgi:hypothetical protein
MNRQNLSGIRPLLLGLLLVLASYWATSYYDGGQYNDLVAKYNTLATSFNSLSSNNTKSEAQVQYVNQQLDYSNKEYQFLLSNYTKTSIIYRAPGANQSIPVWGIKQTVGPNSSISWNLLDTFDNHILVDANANVTFMLIDDGNYARWYNHLPYSPVKTYTGNHFAYDAQISEGCAIYVLLIWNRSEAPVLITPNVTATFAPTVFLTGICSIP